MSPAPPLGHPPRADLAAALARSASRLGPFARQLHCFAEVGSTNDIAAELAAAGAEEGTTVVAAAQTAGRGRRGRTWWSPPGCGLYVSVVLRPRDASLLTFAAGVALAAAIRRATGIAPEIKWPNDLVIRSPGAPSGTFRFRKLAGILAETSGTGDGVILGFGINVRSGASPPEVAERATSLEEHAGAPVDATTLLIESLAALNEVYDALRLGRAGGVLDAWRAQAPSATGASIEWDTPAGVRRGVTVGVDAAGALLVDTDRGVERIVGGEVTWL